MTIESLCAKPERYATKRKFPPWRALKDPSLPLNGCKATEILNHYANDNDKNVIDILEYNQHG
ncbi:hypothetical protein WH47_02936 [Habropoda laboriosa]|uniref:Uncharacterized protein n=1 Tax=Habropoda laboriosa TaxID=597456 RepID=A0A0L7QY44_9HYME|nr:hypothetical protein WH47_02936 [Habropoda laboriosa]